MMAGQATLLWSLVFGSVGLGFFLYGRKQRAVVPLVVGVALLLLPYLVANSTLLVSLGVVLLVIPYFIRL